MSSTFSKLFNKTFSDPYPIFFFFGAIFSILGSLVWLAFFAGISSTYPNISHPQLMIGGFILMFICGFLLTAVPRFTGTKSASFAEIVFILSPILISQCFIYKEFIFYVFQYFAVLNLSVFAIKRVVKRKNNPPPSFIFIGAALLSLHLSLFIKMGISFNLVFADYSFLAKKLYTESTALFLIFGVGSKVIPMIKGFNSEKAIAKPYMLFNLCALVLFFTYLLEYNGQLLSLSVFRNSIFTAMALHFWKTHRAPPRASKLNTSLRIAELMLLLGLWAPLIFPQFYIHFKHILFIGGFGLITLLISTRVLFAHGAAGIDNEKTSGFYWPLVALCGVTLFFRISLAFVSESQIAITSIIAAVSWILLCFLWLYGFYAKALKAKTTSSHAHS